MEKGVFYMETWHLCVYMARLLAKGRVRNLPPGSADNGVYCRIAVSDHESLPTPLPQCAFREASDWKILSF